MTSNHVSNAAIVGSGPSGFYAAEALLQRLPGIQVDMFDRLATPFGLVRSGVAPDHPKLKEVTVVFERIMRSEGFRFFGNVHIGKDIEVSSLTSNYDFVILAYGASGDRKMRIPGEALANCHSATEFVGWYNGHPDFRDLTFDLSAKTAVVVGHGNVAADVCRILLQPPEALSRTDIAEHALDALRRSKVREVHLVGRRGAAQSKFTTKELRGIGNIPGVATVSVGHDLNEASSLEIAEPLNVNAAKNIELFRSFVEPIESYDRKLTFRFCLEPFAVEGHGRVERMVFRRCRLEGAPFEQRAVATDEEVSIDCGLVFTSIGYRGNSLPCIPFDDKLGIVPNTKGRVPGYEGLYVTGWLKRGATGIIGTNRADSIETVQSVIEDIERLSGRRVSELKSIHELVRSSKVHVVDCDAWQKIDLEERSRGELVGKPREKFTRVNEILRCITDSTSESGDTSQADLVCAGTK